MNAMDTVTNAMYAKWQWETFRDRLVRKELTYSTAVQDYLKLVDKMNRTQKELKKVMDNQLDDLVDIAMKYQKAKHRYMWMPTKYNRNQYVELANELQQQKKLITTEMATSPAINKNILHSDYTTEER